MRSILLIVATITMLSAAPTKADEFTGNDLKDLCDSEQQMEEASGTKQGGCMLYIAAVLDSYDMAFFSGMGWMMRWDNPGYSQDQSEKAGQAAIQRFTTKSGHHRALMRCTSKVTTEQAVDVVRKYLEKFPERRNARAPDVIVEAIQTYFYCPIPSALP